MHSPEASLIYPYLRLFYWISGDYVLAYKAGAAALCGCWVWVLWWICCLFRSSGSLQPSGRFISAWRELAPGSAVLSAWSLFSPHLTYFAAQYPKNLMGAVLLLAFIGSLRRSGRGGGLQAAILPGILLIANYFGHRMTFALALLYLAIWFVFRFRKALATKIFSRRNLLFAGILTGLLLAAGLIYPGLFHFADFGRLKGAFAWPPQFAPYSFVTRFGIERISAWWLAEVGLVTGFWLAALFYSIWGLMKHPPHSPISPPHSLIPPPPSPIPNPSSLIPFLALCTLLLFPFLEWTFTGIAWRLFLVFILFTPLLVIDFQIDKWRRSGLVFAAVLLFCSLVSWKSYDPEVHDPDYTMYKAITERVVHILPAQHVDLVIAHNALAEFYTFTTGTDAMPWLPEYAVDSSRLWRIATGVELQTLKYYAGTGRGEGSIVLLGYRYFLLPEYLWQRARRKAMEEKDEEFLAEMCEWRNPCQMRPGWLLRRKRGH